MATLLLNRLIDNISDFSPWVILFLVTVVTILLLHISLRHIFCTKKSSLVFERASRLKPEAIPKGTIDTIVIGSGPGGCACANLISQSGKRVLLLEKHTVTGGGTHSFTRKGCEWDTGLHYTSKAMSSKTERPGALIDFMTWGQQNFRQFPEPYDEIIFPDHSSYSYMNGIETTLDGFMHQIDPADTELKKRVRTFMDLYNDIYKGFVALALKRILPKWLHFLVNKKVNELMRFASLTVRDVQYAVLDLGYSKQDVLKTCPTEATGTPAPSLQRLKAVLAHPIGDYGCQPRLASFASHGVTAAHYMNGGSYTVGPTQNISIRLTSVIQACGGEVLVDACVRDIIIENGKAVGVRVSNTSATSESAPLMEIRANNVVCATSAYNLYNKLLPKDLDIVAQFQDPNERTMRQSNGHNFVFCKLKGDADELGLPDHNLWYFNGDDLDSSFDKFYNDPMSCRPPVVYIGFPCTKDVTWKKRFPGISNCIIISDGLYEWYERWSTKDVGSRGDDYETLKKSITTSLLNVLYEFVPSVKGKVEYLHFATPLTEESYLGSYRGGAYDTLCTPDMFAPINQKWITNPRTAIPGLYLAGSSAFFPGLTGAMYGGCLSACVVLGPFGTIRIGNRIINHLASRLQEENPKLPRWTAYCKAISIFFQ